VHNKLLFLCFMFFIYTIFLPAANAMAKGSSCDAITVAQAAELLGTKPSDLKVETSDMLPDRCVIRSKTDWLTALSFSIYREETSAEASASLHQMAEGFAGLSTIVPVPNLGDEAIYAGDDRLKRLVLRKGRYLIDISSPRDRRRQEKAARILLPGLANLAK